MGGGAACAAVETRPTAAAAARGICAAAANVEASEVCWRPWEWATPHRIVVRTHWHARAAGSSFVALAAAAVAAADTAAASARGTVAG